jgi:hypothetical protein
MLLALLILLDQEALNIKYINRPKLMILLNGSNNKSNLKYKSEGIDLYKRDRGLLIVIELV